MWGFCVWSLFCYEVLCVLSSFAIILMEKRELVAWLGLPGVLSPLVFCGTCSPCRGLVCGVIVVFSDHAHFFSVFNVRPLLQYASELFVL